MTDSHNVVQYDWSLYADKDYRVYLHVRNTIVPLDS